MIMRVRTRLLLCSLAALSLTYPSLCAAETHIVADSVITYIDGFDQHGFRIHDVGGGIDWIRIRSFEYVSFSGDPHSQSFTGLTYQYLPTPASIDLGLSDQHGNPYRRSGTASTSTPTCICS